MPGEIKEYIVTVKDYESLDSFYHDMENSSAVRHIPRRPVQVANKRPISRATHYWLYDGEARNLVNDPRVIGVELTPEARKEIIKPVWSQTSALWNKSSSISAQHRNWGILRCYEQIQRSGWGSNGTTNVSGTVNTTANGRDVDVVIVDGLIDPSHPEYAINPINGVGSRVVQFNWFSLNPIVTGGAAGTYVYTPYVDSSYPDGNGDGISDRTSDNDHGAHVAGTVAGNTLGWAREANIYNISPYGSAPSFISSSLLNDYIRAWHRTKPINPRTGLRNPTITNHSYGSYYDELITNITRVRFRGVEYEGPFDASTLSTFGFYTYYDPGTSSYRAIYPAYSVSRDADIQDAINDGIVYVAAAGNDGMALDSFSTSLSRDYNNYVEVLGFYIDYYMRGTWHNQNVIVVGSVNSESTERKSTFSNTGRRVDLYAPGEAIISSVNSTVGATVGDPRNTSYRLTKYSGTSMASPQVAGVLATIAEQWKTIRNETAKDFIIQTAKVGQLTTSTGGLIDPYDLNFGQNRYLAYNNLRGTEGLVGPKNNLGTRKSTGQLWPRTNILRYGR